MSLLTDLTIHSSPKSVAPVAEADSTAGLRNCHQILDAVLTRFQQDEPLAMPLRQLKGSVLTDNYENFPKSLLALLIQLPLLKQMELETTVPFDASLAKLFSDCIDAQAAQRLSYRNEREYPTLKTRITSRLNTQIEASYKNLYSNNFRDMAHALWDKYRKHCSTPIMTFRALPIFCLEQGNVDEAVFLCGHRDPEDPDLHYRHALNAYFKPYNQLEIEKVGMPILLKLVNHIQNQGWRQNYQLDAATYYIEKGRFAEAFTTLQSTGKPIAEKLNQILMQKAETKPLLLQQIGYFSLSLDNPQERAACLQVYESRTQPAAFIAQGSVTQGVKRARGNSPG